MNRQNKKICITVFHSFISKNILNTDVFSILKSNKNLEITLVVPKTKESFFSQKYSKDNVKVVGVDVASILSRNILVFFSRWSKLLIRSHYLWYKRIEKLNSALFFLGYLKYFIEQILVVFFSYTTFLKVFFRYIFKNFVREEDIKELFDKIQPDVLFATDVFDEMDTVVMAEADYRKIMLIGMVRSWDNCYSKGLMRVIPDYLIVNNETIKEEANIIHGVPVKDIYVLGSPQYDLFSNEARISRDDFFRQTNLDPNKKLIIFAPAGTILSDTDSDILDILVRNRENGSLRCQPSILVRNHPNHPADLGSFSGISGVNIENPGFVFNKQNPKETELTLNDNLHLANELFYADVVVYVATTLGVDSLLFDKPQIIINFDGYKSKPYGCSVRRYHDEDHMKKMIDLGGVTLVSNEKDLVESINHYIKDPSWNSSGRASMRRQQFFKPDGMAGKRIGDFIISILLG